MAVWVAEASNPQAWGQTCFSNIVYESGHWVVYAGGPDVAKFYRYNIDTNVFTELTDPPDALDGQLAVSPDGTKVVGHASKGTVLYIYDINSPGWTTSAVTPGYWPLYSMVWADDDTIWCHIRAIPNIRFCKYTLSTNSWESYAHIYAPTVTWSSCMCISTDGKKLYASCGAYYNSTTKYTIDTDTYAAGPTLFSAYYFVFAADRHKLWFGPRRTTPATHGTITRWVNPDTEVLEADVFPEYGPATKPSNLPVGVYGKTMCIAGFMTAAPENLSINLASLPTVTTDAASSIGLEEATLNGTLDGDGGETCECGFEWGETVAYGNTTPTEAKTTGQAFAQTITGLDRGKTYHFRAFAANPAGTSYGSDETFTILLEIPTVSTNPASAVGQTTATLNGTLDDDGGEACDCGFEYGETTDYGTETPTQSKTTGETFSQEVLGLMSGRVYHFRAKATNSVDTSYGTDRTFHTEALSAEAHEALGKGYALGRHGL